MADFVFTVSSDNELIKYFCTFYFQMTIFSLVVALHRMTNLVNLPNKSVQDQDKEKHQGLLADYR